jgi:hypothetical protein
MASDIFPIQDHFVNTGHKHKRSGEGRGEERRGEEREREKKEKKEKRKGYLQSLIFLA